MVSAALACLALAGCEPDEGIVRVPVSGAVTLDGRPVEQGVITFMPQGGENVASADIVDGRYDLRRPEGPSPGPHQVAIWSRVPTGRKVVGDPLMPGELVDEYAESIPDRYNAKTELSADVQEDGDNHFDFVLVGGKAT